MKTFTWHLRVWLLPLACISGVELTCVAGQREQTPNLDAYRKYALTHEGDVARGAQLFADEQRLDCVKCHTVDGSGGKAGPDLFAVGDKFGRRDIVDAVLMPSATISPGYNTVIVETKAGEEVQGVLKQSTAAGLQLMGADGKVVSIAKAEIKEQRGSSLSLMPEGLQAGLSVQEFTDLTEYLTTLKQPENTLASNHGMPMEIPQIAKPVVARRFFSERFTLPRGKQETGLTAIQQVPGLSNVFLVLHQRGVIWRVEKKGEGEEKSVFVDLTGEVFSDRGPNGLLDLAFHPKFRENRKYYLKYQVFEDGKVATLVVEKTFAPDFKSDSGNAGRRVIKIESVAEDHSGGCLEFGPDGFLYLVMGDTGPHNDPNGHAQNLQLLLGKIMRIDVDGRAGDLGYAIPKDNPFVGRSDARPEIWAYGFRNPWRFSFDPVTGDLWLADVGQDRVEEVDIVHRGENYGWNVFEGFEPFSNQYKKEGRTFTQPVFEYRRKYGASITGGYVYRGDKASSFYGVYVCGDFTSKRIFGVTQENGVLKTVREIGSVPERLVSFGRDEAGQLYAVSLEGSVYQLDFSGARFDEEKKEGVHAENLKRVEQADFGKASDGSEVKLITLRNSKGMRAQIISYGAIIKEVQAPDRNGKFTNVVLSTDSIEKYERFGGSAAVIGRVANRIAGAQFELDGKTYKLPANNGKNTIHGGRKGFAQSVWTVEEVPQKPGESSVKLTYLSRDGEQGFPGNLKTSVTYTLTDKNELRINYEAETDKPTIVNLTNHAYWNLAGGGSCLDNILWIPASSYTPADDDLIPTGEIAPLAGTPMDFQKPTRIGERFGKLNPKLHGYDHNYILGEDGVMKMAARLIEPKSGRIMEVRTTQPAVQLYTGNHLGNTAVCLEMQHYPDSIHHPNFPSIVVRPGKPLKETAVFSFLAK
ncbi:MAG: galactose-1-epimerase [Verrucomicrobiota bacterium]